MRGTGLPRLRLSSRWGEQGRGEGAVSLGRPLPGAPWSSEGQGLQVLLLFMAPAHLARGPQSRGVSGAGCTLPGPGGLGREAGAQLCVLLCLARPAPSRTRLPPGLGCLGRPSLGGRLYSPNRNFTTWEDPDPDLPPPHPDRPVPAEPVGAGPSGGFPGIWAPEASFPSHCLPSPLAATLPNIHFLN